MNDAEYNESVRASLALVTAVSQPEQGLVNVALQNVPTRPVAISLATLVWTMLQQMYGDEADKQWCDFSQYIASQLVDAS